MRDHLAPPAAMRVFSHDTATFPLPPGHRFPLSKYRLLRERLLADGVVRPQDVHAPAPVAWSTLGRVHAPALLHRIRTGAFGERERRGLGLPWSPQLVERGRRSVAGTIAAAHDALAHGLAMNLGGGTHHAGRDVARGFCLFNDVAVATAELRAAGAIRRVLVVDCDVFTLSQHGARNYPFKRIPSDLDVDLATGTGDDGYLEALDGALQVALAAGRPDLAFFLAGADPWEGDRLGRLSVTKAGLAARDVLVLDRLRAQEIPVCVVLAGGYPEDVGDAVDINAATAVAVADRRPLHAGRRPR
jgi:acetoin utilization deacetylase AcuC-like enzyme